MSTPIERIVDDATGLGARLLSMAQTRLELLGVEAQREKAALARQLTLAVICGMTAALGAFAAILWVALSFPPDWRFRVLGAMTALFVLAAIVCGFLLWRASRRRELLFGRLADVLRRDREALEAVHARQRTEPPRDAA